METPPNSPSDSVLKRIEGFARTSHDSGYEQGYVDAYRQVRTTLARRSLVYLLLGLILGGTIVMLLAMRGIFGEAFAPPAADPRELGSTRGLRFKAAADFAKDYTVAIRVQTRSGWRNQGQMLAGSGFVFDDKGRIVTNTHVVKDGVRFQVSWRGRLYEAKLLGTSTVDVAVLQFNASGVKAAAMIGDNEPVQLAEEVLAIGSPFGLDHSVTQGIVSFAARRLDDGIAYIQTDCAINHGNSGGPLVNLEGRVIGMNRMIVSGGGDSAGVGFAIPLNVVKHYASEIIRKAGDDATMSSAGDEGQMLESAYIGFMPTERSNRVGGVEIGEVIAGTPAAVAGLRPGDLVVGIDSTPINAFDELRDVLAQNYSPGQKARLTIKRNGKQLQLDLTLSARVAD